MDKLDLFIETPEYHDLKIMNESKDTTTGKWSVTFETILQDLSKPTSNRRFYPKNTMVPAIQKIESFIRKNHLFGEWDHPLSDIMKATSDEMALKRHISILWEKVSHQFLKIWIDGPYVRGVVKTLHTKYGEDMTNLILLDKVSIGFSLRSAGTSKPNKQGYEEVQAQGFSIITWDAVVNPASPIALFDAKTESYQMTESVTTLDNSFSIDTSGGERCINGVCDLIKHNPDILSESSSHVKMQLLEHRLQEVFDNLKF